MDTCIAIRTMTFKDGVAYLQAGGGIVFDSVEEDEYTETINKLGGNVRALHDAERQFFHYVALYLVHSRGCRILVPNTTKSEEKRYLYDRIKLLGSIDRYYWFFSYINLFCLTRIFFRLVLSSAA